MTQIEVLAHPGSRRNCVQVEQDLFGQEIYHVYTSAKPIDGEANKAVIQLIADFFTIKKYQIRLVSGETSRHKRFEIVSTKF